jgi:large subunit ribosomal protein L13
MATLTKNITATAKANDLRPRWQVLDAKGQVLGRLSVQVAHILKGKHKPNYSPHMLTGDFVIVINAGKVRVTGRKADQKVYYSHSQYPGGLKEVPYESMMAKHPTRVVEHAVKGMLPHNRLGRQMFRRLKVYEGPEHPHESQVADSLNALEKDREEGVAWLGLPKPLYKKRLRKGQESSEAPAPAIVEATADAETPEEPTAEAEPLTSDAEPVVEAEDSVEEAEPTAEIADEVVDSEPVAEVEGAEASETKPTEEEKERGA